MLAPVSYKVTLILIICSNTKFDWGVHKNDHFGVVFLHIKKTHCAYVIFVVKCINIVLLRCLNSFDNRLRVVTLYTRRTNNKFNLYRRSL